MGSVFEAEVGTQEDEVLERSGNEGEGEGEGNQNLELYTLQQIWNKNPTLKQSIISWITTALTRVLPRTLQVWIPPFRSLI